MHRTLKLRLQLLTCELLSYACPWGTVRCNCFFRPDVVPSAVTQLSSCLADVAAWLSASRLRLNTSKTVVIWLGSKYQVDWVGVHAVPVLTSTVPIVDSARAPGVVLDSRLTMAAHVVSVCRSAYYQLRQLRPIMKSLSVDAANMLAHSSHHAWTIATQRYTAWSTACFGAYNRSKCHRTLYHWHAAQGPYHSDPPVASLAHSPWTSHLQARLVGFQGAAWSIVAVSHRWLSAARRYRAPPTPVVWHCNLFCPVDSLVSLRSLFHCGWTENMEQFAYQIATTRPQPWTIQAAT